MGAYVDLSQEDKDRVQSLLTLVRPEVARLYKDSVNASAMLSDWNSGVSAIVASLDAAEPIPNDTGLAGAVSVSKEALANNLMAYITTRAGFSTQAHLDNIVPAAGAVNVQI